MFILLIEQNYLPSWSPEVPNRVAWKHIVKERPVRKGSGGGGGKGSVWNQRYFSLGRLNLSLGVPRWCDLASDTHACIPWFDGGFLNNDSYMVAVLNFTLFLCWLGDDQLISVWFANLS